MGEALLLPKRVERISDANISTQKFPLRDPSSIIKQKTSPSYVRSSYHSTSSTSLLLYQLCVRPVESASMRRNVGVAVGNERRR